MGNCVGAEGKSTAEIAPSELIKQLPVVKLYGKPESFATSHIRLAVMYKPVTLEFIPSESHQEPVLMYQSDVVSGSVENILGYLDSKFPNPKMELNTATATASNTSIWGWCGEKTPAIVWVVALQHRSMNWHLDKMVKWAEDIASRGGKARGDPSMGSPRMELKKFAKSYSQLQQVMLEHAQMEETVLFQILESADRGLCKAANEEHGRDLPIMNGIKEEIKTIGVMNVGSPDYQEVFSSLILRLKRLQGNCKQHFEEEERELMPLMEAAELKKPQQEKALQQSLDIMRETHSTLFRFFMEGLQPNDAMQYFDLIKRYCDNVRVSLMLHMLID